MLKKDFKKILNDGTLQIPTNNYIIKPEVPIEFLKIELKKVFLVYVLVFLKMFSQFSSAVLPALANISIYTGCPTSY